MERLEPQIPIEEIIGALKEEGIDISPEEAAHVLHFLNHLSRLVLKEYFDVDPMSVE